MMTNADTTDCMPKLGYKLLNAIFNEVTSREIEGHPAKAVGVDSKTLRGWGQLERFPKTAASRMKLIKFFGSWDKLRKAVDAATDDYPAEMLLTRDGGEPMPAPRRIPLFDLQTLPAERYSETNPLTARDAANWVTVDEEIPSDAFALRISGDCMTPTYNSGDKIIFAPITDFGGSKEFANGRPYYVEHTDGKATFKLVFLAAKGKYKLQPENPKYRGWTEDAANIMRLSLALKVIRDIT